MTVFEVAAGVFIICWTVWTLVLYLLQKCKIEQLEKKLKECNKEGVSGDQVWDIN